jgi:hypothetical protein
MSSGGGGSSSQTSTVTQTIPQFEQDFAQANQNLANDLGSTPYPVYQGQLQAPLTSLQQQALKTVGDAANSYRPDLQKANNTLDNSSYLLRQFDNLSGQTSANASNDPVAMGQAYMPSLMGGAQNSITMGSNYAPGLMSAASQAGNNTASLGDAGALEQTGAALGTRGAQNIALDPSDTATVQRFMNPYVQAALDPQIQQLNLQYGKQAQDLASQATSAGAFGDARLGVSQSLNNYYNNLATSGVEAQGYNTAYNNAMSTIGNQQQLGLGEMNGASSAFNQAGTLRQGQQGLQLQGAQIGNQILTGQQANQLSATGLQNTILTGQQQAGFNQMAAAQAAQKNLMEEQAAQLARSQQYQSLGTSAQTLGLNASNAKWAAGQAEQQQQQTADNLAYQQYMNQVNWPYQQLNVRESALSNSPYTMQNAVTLPGTSNSATNLGAFASLLGLSGASSGWGSSTVPQAIK